MAASRGTAQIAESVELAQVIRGDFVESRHAGSAVVLDPSGEIILSLGSPDTPFYTRSALKPLQTLAMQANGLELTSDAERVISMASHYGSRKHGEIVWRMLAAGGLNDQALKCPADWPLGRREASEHASRGGKRERLLHCCSGKHAAMLRTCQASGWDLATYAHEDHPLQQAIKETVQRFTGEVPHVSVDGCGVPTHAVTLTGFARAIRRMATSEPSSPFPVHRNAYELFRATRENGWIIAGHGSGDTTLIDGLGVFSKFGAEGSVVVAAPDGTTVAVKMLDGSGRGVHLVAAELLKRVGAISEDRVEAVKEHLNLRISGGGAPVGMIEVAF